MESNSERYVIDAGNEVIAAQIYDFFYKVHSDQGDQKISVYDLFGDRNRDYWRSRTSIDATLSELSFEGSKVCLSIDNVFLTREDFDVMQEVSDMLDVSLDFSVVYTITENALMSVKSNEIKAHIIPTHELRRQVDDRMTEMYRNCKTFKDVFGYKLCPWNSFQHEFTHWGRLHLKPEGFCLNDFETTAGMVVRPCFVYNVDNMILFRDATARSVIELNDILKSCELNEAYLVKLENSVPKTKSQQRYEDFMKSAENNSGTVVKKSFS